MTPRPIRAALLDALAASVASEARQIEALEHFPPKWMPVRLRKCVNSRNWSKFMNR
jgi:hypothetical protein